MKRLFSLCLLLLPLVAMTQTTDSTKVEQYCEMVAQQRILSTKVNIDVNYGEVRKFFRTYGVKDETGRLVKFNSVVDAMNYMGQQGWKLVNAFPVAEPNLPIVYHYVFKKEFLKSEIDRAEN